MGAPKAKAAPAGPRNGSQIQKQLGSNFEKQGYSAVANDASTDLGALVRTAFERDGPAAFEMPKRAAAIHEAGHAVLFTANRILVRTVRIKSKVRYGKVCWGGRTSAGEAWRIWPGTPLPVILQRLRFEIAGLVAEMLFLDDKDFRSGSSLDELARARQLAAMASIAGGGGTKAEIFEREAESVRATLREHEPTVRTVADALERAEWLHGKQVLALLAPVAEGVE